jgi:hypothetical protein
MVRRLSPALVPALVVVAIILAASAWLLWIGREPWCTCGYVKLWHGEVFSSENSQHLSDWYTPSHILHGFLFYGLLWLIARRLSFGWRLAVATAVESAWEVIENSDAIIERYRAVTISLDYYGDSVLNSVADIGAMIFGFWLASRLPVPVTVALFLLVEGVTIWLIRDGLLLNILMLSFPIDAVSTWQAGR